MKRWISLLLTAVLLFALLPASAEEDEILLEEGEEILSEDDGGFEDEDEEEKPGLWVEYDYDELVVGNPTRLNGQFFTEMWGNVTSDIDVRQLVNGYNLITWDGDLSVFRPDHSVVSGMVVGDDREGNRRYLFSLYDDLYYSDGTPITAWDYAFSVLLQCSPLIAQTGGVPNTFDFLLGFEDYVEGRAGGLAGLRVIDDRQLVFIVKQESLPYFYELGRFAFCPYPIQTIAPGCRVYDTDQGTLIGSAESVSAESPFTAELLNQTVMAANTGYLVYPAPCSGPYILQTYDGETATFAINGWYKGNEEGLKPRIRHITYTWADNDEMIARLGEGDFVLLNKVTLSQAVYQGMELGTLQQQFTRAAYPRTGLTYFYFMPTSPLVQSGNLRKALAHSLQKSDFLQQYVGYFGLEADGLYGLAQWMYQLAQGTMLPPVQEPENPTAEEQRQYEEALAAWEEINLDGLTRYEFDLDQAAALLEADGWNLNESGQPFRLETDSIRYRQTESGLEPLRLTIAYTDEQEEKEPLEAYFLSNLRQLGVDAVLVESTLSRLGELLDGTEDAPYDLIYLGNNFSPVFAPASLFYPGASLWQEGMAEDSIPATHRLMQTLAWQMDATEPTDVLGYMQKWLVFQQSLSETLPILPVYINVYFDFYARELHDYWIAEYSSWADAIISARMFEAESPSEEEREALFADFDRAASSEVSSGSDLSNYYGERRIKTELDPTAGALAAFPQEIRDQIPAEYRTINEFISATLSDSYQNVRTARVNFAFETTYPAGDTVYLIFGVMKGNNTEWFVQPASVLTNGGVSVELSRDQLDRLAGTTFPLVVVSKW